ncbi:unnamed protein product [Arabidopsis halleri]
MSGRSLERKNPNRRRRFPGSDSLCEVISACLDEKIRV